MSLCVEVVDSVLQVVSGDTCTYVVMTAEEASQLVSNQTDWSSYLEFDEDLYQFVLVQALVTFVGGHMLGRIAKYFGKA
ncbi:transcriptional regulator [Vibrio sp. CAIM 722]|uniref:Transcriptional regulator n=1 Tax=Vibrio eleionomae TaxID=2653505 RepID=A0A7X4LKH3_9VIBR|nr:transcriptional regulator [Vibrio eleionomae]MZI93241.1 transcriptional regulator [Vibrio eleionomae]